jgi:hypothetical protein
MIHGYETYFDGVKGKGTLNKFDTTVPIAQTSPQCKTTTNALEFTTLVHTIVLDCWCCYCHTHYMRTTDHHML